MKITNLHPILEGMPVIQEELQGNITDIASALCNIDGRLIPEGSVGLAEVGELEPINFVNEPLYQSTSASGFTTWAERGATTTQTHTPRFTVLPESIYTAGWNKLSDLDNTYGTRSSIVLPSTPGRIIGAATIDSELRCSVAVPYINADLPYTNRDLWWEFAVFANGSEIGRSPRLSAGRHTVTIPFCTFSGAEQVTIDLRVRAYFGKQMAKATTSRNREPLALHNFQVWANITSK